MRDPTFLHVRDIEDLREGLLGEIGHFFRVYKDLEPGKTEAVGFGDRAEGIAALARATRRAAESRPVEHQR